MADQSLAGQWLKDNGHTWSGKPPRGSRPRHVRVGKTPDREPVFYHDLDRLAYEALMKAQSRPRRQRGYGPKLPKVYKPRGLDFLRENVGFDQPQCLLMPGAHWHGRSGVTLNGNGMPAARAMCILAHGHPPNASDCARHLCGNGHLNCVNPVHLAWGSVFENRRDAQLHSERPRFMPDISAEVRAQIEASNELPNVLAIRYQIPSAVIDLIQRGLA